MHLRLEKGRQAIYLSVNSLDRCPELNFLIDRYGSRPSLTDC
jgi:hypothetical protein